MEIVWLVGTLSELKARSSSNPGTNIVLVGNNCNQRDWTKQCAISGRARINAAISTESKVHAYLDPFLPTHWF